MFLNRFRFLNNVLILNFYIERIFSFAHIT